MNESLIDLPWPVKGMAVNVPFDKQPPLTTPSAINVCGRDPTTGRVRGAQRAGLTKYTSPATQISGSNTIQCITHNIYTKGGNALSPRLIARLAVANGDVRKFTTTAVTVPTNGTGALSATATFIAATQLLTKTYFVDGTNYKYFDPSNTSMNTLVASAGSLPIDGSSNTARLVVTWRSRLVFAGVALDPQNWFMSDATDATKYDYGRSPSVETMPVAGNNVSATATGYNADVINCMIPYNDEILLFGGDHSIHQMTGDPMSGGRIDLVTDAVGMAWGTPWARDGTGRLYFISNRGSIYAFMPGDFPQRISDPLGDTIFTNDMSKTKYTLAWDERQQGLYVFITPTTVGAATHYFYDAVNNGWYQLSFATNNHNPLVLDVLDADTAGDRTILLGSFDGYVRQVGYAAKDDDGAGINASVFLGPIKDEVGSALLVCDVQGELGASSDSVTWSLLSAQGTEDAYNAAARFSGTWTAGRNRSVPARSFGHAHWLKLQSANAASKAFQLEYVKALVRKPVGRAPQRMF